MIGVQRYQDTKYQKNVDGILGLRAQNKRVYAGGLFQCGKEENCT